MKRFFLGTFFLLLVSIIFLIIMLSTVGIKTNKFNNLISNRISEVNKNIKIDLNEINFKIDLKKISLFLQTNSPQLEYRSTIIPVQNINIYLEFFPLIRSEARIKKLSLILDKLDIKQLKEISTSFKPSNLKNILNNKIINGKLFTEIDIFFNNNNDFDNFIAKGKVLNLDAEIYKDLNLHGSNFSFFADKSDILIKNISGKSEYFQINEGDLKLNLSSQISIDANLKTDINYTSNTKKNFKLLKDFKYFKNIDKLNADLETIISLNFDETYKLKRYDLKLNGKILNAIFNNKNYIKYDFLKSEINQFSLKETKIKANIEPKNNKTSLNGKYSINNGNLLKFDLDYLVSDNVIKSKINFDFNKQMELQAINYTKQDGSLANIFINFERKKNILRVKEFKFIENDNLILAEDFVLKKNKFSSLKKISVSTNKDKKKNNDFNIRYKDKIYIKGNNFDASNLLKILAQKTNKNILSSLNSEIEIDFANISFPSSEKLKSFKLIGKIDQGKFSKISSKGDFGDNNFLDITMENDVKNKKKYLEIYSDLTKPLLSDYNFFNGLSGGKLFYSAIIEENYTNSKLNIENFKVVNAPGLVKLLSLADLRGLADLAEGEGLTFDILEIEMEKTKDELKLKEILALGPSISVLMEGYQTSTVTSLRGTLVPAKTLNKLISKIPLIGDIIIPKEIGEGLFGISFKMKGPSGKVKTTINPIRTLTPRFIQKIIDKNKNTK